MATQDTTTPATAGDRSALALSVLCEASDLLTVLREHGNEDPDRLGSAQWTLTTEISRRINTAIATLDEAVPHPEDEDGSVGGGKTGQPEGTFLERGQYVLLVSDGIHEIVSGIRGIADTLEGTLFDDIQNENAQRLVLALQHLSRCLHDAAYDDAPGDWSAKIRAVLEAPDPPRGAA